MTMISLAKIPHSKLIFNKSIEIFVQMYDFDDDKRKI